MSGRAEVPIAPEAALVLDFAGSELFDRTFKEGMQLVEEAAEYLDGAGRQESKRLSRNGALAYAGESMKVTTRLMQIASWLLVQRAVREGDMPASDAAQPRYRIDPRPPQASGLPVPTGASEPLPQGLTSLTDRAARLYERIVHLDRRMYLGGEDALASHPVLEQHARPLQAFGAAC